MGRRKMGRRKMNGKSECVRKRVDFFFFSSSPFFQAFVLCFSIFACFALLLFLVDGTHTPVCQPHAVICCFAEIESQTKWMSEKGKHIHRSKKKKKRR